MELSNAAAVIGDIPNAWRVTRGLAAIRGNLEQSCARHLRSKMLPGLKRGHLILPSCIRRFDVNVPKLLSD
jgi:hypothetical protein